MGHRRLIRLRSEQFLFAESRSRYDRLRGLIDGGRAVTDVGEAFIFFFILIVSFIL
jgi:hypothetical protein